MGDGRISEVGHLSTTHEGIISQWAQLAAEARSASGRTAACPSGGTLRERSQLLRAINRLQFQRNVSDDALVCSQQNIINIYFITFLFYKKFTEINLHAFNVTVLASGR